MNFNLSHTHTNVVSTHIHMCSNSGNIPFSNITIKKVIYNLALIEAWSIQSKYRQFIFQVQVGNSNFTYVAANREATEHITHIRIVCLNVC